MRNFLPAYILREKWFNGRTMSPTHDYNRNDEMFLAFRELQRRFAGHLARHPALIRVWLDAQPACRKSAGSAGCASRSWRTARLNSSRRSELAGLLGQAEKPGADPAPLAAWLLAALPVRTYLKIADGARPDLAAIDPEAGRCLRELMRMREELLLANYGLARVAARQRRAIDYDDRMSAASCGLLDAIDRYVPGARAARFSYFASYWIRYHVSRQSLKAASLVSYPVHQHRVNRRIARYVAERSEGDRAPSQEQIRADLKLGLNACCWHHPRPSVVSLHSPPESDPDSPALENRLADPAPDPAAILEEAEADSRLCALLRVHAPPATRLMLAYAHGIGALPEAADEYLSHLKEMVRERMRRCGTELDAPPGTC